MSPWLKLLNWIRNLFYPRNFRVAIVDADNLRNYKFLDFQALQKIQPSGLFGDCDEALIVSHTDYVRLFGQSLFEKFNFSK